MALLTEKKNLRVLTARPPHVPEIDVRTIEGGLLVQTRDLVSVDRSAWQVVTGTSTTRARATCSRIHNG